MTHDRMQPNVHFTMCERGFLIDVTPGMGMVGTRYAFDKIEDVAQWFIDQYAPGGLHGAKASDGRTEPASGTLLASGDGDTRIGR